MKITFVCTGNTCRSPLAQAFFEKKIAELKLENVECDSAGIQCPYGMSISQNSQNVLKKLNIDFTHKSQPLTAELVDSSDKIITMTKAHKMMLQGIIEPSKLFCVDDFTFAGDIADPYGSTQEVYDIVAEQIKNAVDKIIFVIFGL